MGGLAVDVSDIDDRLHSLTLTPSGLELLAERGHFIEVSDDDIRDKSKADIFAKCLVILQVSWIALQTISRKATGYPLSPLEVHTLVHAACASVMYILWFRKPLDVQAPTIVSTAGFEDLIALMLMQTPRLGGRFYSHFDLMLNPQLGRTWYSHLDPPKDFEPFFTRPRSEASFLMFDDSALSRRDEGCSSCGRHSTPSTTTNLEVVNKGKLHAIPKTCDTCVNLSNSEPHQARISEARTLSSQITPHPPASIRCELPPGVKAVCELRSGDFIPDGIGLQPLMTMASYHDGYVPLPWWGCFLRFLNPCPPKPALLAQISPALKERLPELSSEPDYWHEIHLFLSERDLKRWKLAGAAFLKEFKTHRISDRGNGRYRKFEIDQLRYEGGDIEGGDIEGSDIEGSDIEGSGIEGSDIEDGDIEDGDIEDGDIEDGDIEDGDIEDGDIEGSDIEGDIEGWCFGRLLASRCPNVSWGYLNDDSIKLLLANCLLGSLYGGIHLALWSYNFPSRLESLFWRVSGVTLVSVQVLAVHVPLLYITKKKYKKYSRRRRRRQAELPPALSTSIDWLRKIFAKFCSGFRWMRKSWCKHLIWAGIRCLGGAGGIIYIFARIFIVVESFISLRHVPIGVYEGGLGWSKYIPHL